MKLFLECKPDEALCITLGYEIYKIEHCQGRTKVCNKLNKSKKTKGLMDEDPGKAQHPYLKKLKLIENKFNIKHYIHKDNENKIIVLQPDLEGWIINLCSASKIDIRRFGLPDNFTSLHFVINNRIDKFNKLIKHMYENKINDIIYLKNLLLTK